MAAIIYPLWIGIAFNLVMTGYDNSRRGRTQETAFSRWYFTKKGDYAMYAVWTFLVCWVVLNIFLTFNHGGPHGR